MRCFHTNPKAQKRAGVSLFPGSDAEPERTQVFHFLRSLLFTKAGGRRFKRFSNFSFKV